jgi:hypothetical protein
MKKHLALIAFVLGIIPLQAQETTLWGKINYFLTKPAAVDTTRIYQPKPCFSLGLFTTGQKAGFDTNVKFNLDFDGESLPASRHTNSVKIFVKKSVLRLDMAISISVMDLKLDIRVPGKKAHSHSIS